MRRIPYPEARPSCARCRSDSTVYCQYHRLNFCSACAHLHNDTARCIWSPSVPLRLEMSKQMLLPLEVQEEAGAANLRENP